MLRRRQIPLFLAALAALLLGAPGTASASAQTTAEAKTRVGASDPATEARVGGQAAEKPSTHRGTTTRSARVASGYLDATKAGSRRWGAHNGPGPLGDDVAGTFRGASYTERVTSQETRLYRAYGGESGPISKYWTSVKPQGPMQAKLDSALPPGNTATEVSEIVVPKGTKIYEGATAPKFGRPGGGPQVVVPRVNPRWRVR